VMSAVLGMDRMALACC